MVSQNWFTRLITASARRAGITLSSYPPPQSLPWLLRQVFEAGRINCALDVGAHEGEFRDLLRRDAGFPGRIVSFEPAGQPFSVLERRSREDEKWWVRRWALGAADGVDELRVFHKTKLSSFRRPTAFLLAHIQPGLEHLETVPIRRLDSIFADCVAGIERPRIFLKTDTQGTDLDVLQGATDSLRSILVLQVEVSVKQQYQGVPDFLEAIGMMTREGFELAGLYPVSRDNFSVIEFDCVMVRSDVMSGGNT
jgi:FkbM family methyltransferase